MIHASITLLYGSLVLLLVGGLGARVSMMRGQKKTYIGDTPDNELQRAIRAHGNAVEYAPLQLILLLGLEMSGSGSMVLHCLGGAIVLVRLMHATGVITKSPLSTAAAGLNYLLCSGMGLYGLIVHFH